MLVTMRYCQLQYALLTAPMPDGFGQVLAAPTVSKFSKGTPVKQWLGRRMRVVC